MPVSDPLGGPRTLRRRLARFGPRGPFGGRWLIVDETGYEGERDNSWSGVV